MTNVRCSMIRTNLRINGASSRRGKQKLKLISAFSDSNRFSSRKHVHRKMNRVQARKGFGRMRWWLISWVLFAMHRGGKKSASRDPENWIFRSPLYIGMESAGRGTFISPTGFSSRLKSSACILPLNVIYCRLFPFREWHNNSSRVLSTMETMCWGYLRSFLKCGALLTVISKPPL